MAGNDPNEEWLGHVQPVGLVVAPVVLKTYDLVPEQQTRTDTEAVKAHLTPGDTGPALADAWAFFVDILKWRPRQVAGSPGGAPIPDDLILRIDESDVEIAPHWAVTDPAGGYQILVRVEAPGVEPDRRGALEGWEATPHQRLERLCKERQVRIGLLVTDAELRLIYAPRGETSGWLRFPLRSLGEVGGRPMLGGLKLLLSSFRLHNDAPERRLPALLQKSRDEQAEVSTKLAAQVLGALHELMRGLHDADRTRLERLARTNPEHVYDGLLTVLLRLVFLLYAEDRDLIPSRTDTAARALYDQGYGVRSLHARLAEDRARHELTMHLRRGAWARLLALFRLVHAGDRSDWIRGRGGKLFDPAAFPFLQGQDDPADPPKPADVSDECIAKVLDRLLVLGGEKLSYRTLDVEQIGSVYETVMGFTVETMDGPALAIRAGKNDKTPVFVNLSKLLAAKPADRAKYLKEDADRGKLPDKVDKAVKTAATIDALVDALRPIVDERASPGATVAAPGTPLLQPTDERRRTGSHYTPRSLTGPIVQHALEPAFDRIGPDATPEDVLSLKVCDPAMGSGAFLVEACRALGERLVMAWARWPQTRPTIPPDEDEPLHARRLVAQRCLYGVDRNPRAVDLAKLSLWLATLARDHEFTFLDHALKCGDSLVGLDDRQIAAMAWSPDARGLPLFRKYIADKVTEVATKRAEIQAAHDDTMRTILEQKHRAVETVIETVRVPGDAVLSAFFGEEKPKAREKRREKIENLVLEGGASAWDQLTTAAASLHQGDHPIRPFHWPIEFPEVFRREPAGFDAIVGNPPFLGGTNISGANGSAYKDYLQATVEESSGKGDLCAHFFRRGFSILRSGGTFGLVATNTISQGATREMSLRVILRSGGRIIRAVPRLRWPGSAAVIVSIVHVLKGPFQFGRTPLLNEVSVERISAYLVAGQYDESPSALFSNKGISFNGSKIYGNGFTFDDADTKRLASPISKMKELLERDSNNRIVIKPYLGGEEASNDPAHRHRRYVIDFGDMPLRREPLLPSWLSAQTDQRKQWLAGGVVPADFPFSTASDWPDLLQIVEASVRPERLKSKNADVRAFPWWKFWRPRNELYRTIVANSHCLVANAGASPHHAIARLPVGATFSHALAVFAYSKFAPFAALQARPHEVWARFFASSMKDDLRYTPSDCFETFPFPPGFETSPALEAAGQAYHDFRAALMVENDQGMTKTYNRFHDPLERSPGIQRLRELHADMDRAVLAAYGWDDLAARAEPVFLEKPADEYGKGFKPGEPEDDHTYQGRLFWPSDFRDEVLARLLALNAERAAAEKAAGLVAKLSDEDDGEEE